jgi:hypothetical protein
VARLLSIIAVKCGWKSIARQLELDAALGEDAFPAGVFDFAHFGDGVGVLWPGRPTPQNRDVGTQIEP